MDHTQMNIAFHAYAIPSIRRLVEKESKVVEKYVNDVTSFEQECYRRVGKAFTDLSDQLLNEYALAKQIITKVRNDHLKRRKRKFNPYSIDALASEDGKVFEIKDDLAIVEDLVLGTDEDDRLKEKISSLAQGDTRKIAILNAWAYGDYNDSELSNLLAKILGRNPETHRKFIQRFRRECQTKLGVIA